MTNRRRNRGASRPRAGAADEANGFRADIAPEKPDEPRPPAKPIWLHPSVSDTLREWSHLYRRLGLILEQLAAPRTHRDRQGVRAAEPRLAALAARRRTRQPVILVVGDSRGIAGSSGPADSCGAEPGTIVVRAVRHHDDHAALGGGRRADYLPIQQATDMDEDIAGRPQNRQQASFETDRSPVRVLRGRPGSGKTTALWRAIEARSGEHVLYVIWSARLQRSAEERLAAFAPSTSRVCATEFRTLAGEITSADVRRISPAESRRKLGLAIEQAVGHERHPWKDHEAAVYAEVRGRLLGRGVDGEADSNEGAKLAALRPDAYRRQRGNEQGIGAGTAKTLLRLWEKVPESTRVEIFPELAAAAAAARLLSSKGLPEGMEFDRLVVDEGAGPDPDRVLDAARAAPGMPQAHGQEPVAADSRGGRTAGRGQRLRVGTLHRVAEQPLAQAGNVRPARARALPVADRGRRQPVEHLLQPGRQEPPAGEAAAGS